MAPNPVSFTLKSPIFYRLFSNSTIPISNFSQRSQLSLNPVQFTGFRVCFSCNSCSYPLNSRFNNLGFSDLGWQLNADRICTSAVSGGDSGDLGGSGDGNSGGGGGGEAGGGDSGGDNWYLEMFATFAVLFQFLTPALLNCIGDLFRQLVIEQASSLDVKRTVISTSMGLPLVGHTLLFWSFVHREISSFIRFLDLIFHGLAFMLLVLVFFCFRFLAEAYVAITKERALEDEIESLPKYRYCHDNRLRPMNDDKNQESLDSNPSNELSLLPEDSDCCICLCRYEEGVELNVLPCKHHFHCECISKWLRINATCPVCKCSIRRSGDLPRLDP